MSIPQLTPEEWAQRATTWEGEHQVAYGEQVETAKRAGVFLGCAGPCKQGRIDPCPCPEKCFAFCDGKDVGEAFIDEHASPLFWTVTVAALLLLAAIVFGCAS